MTPIPDSTEEITSNVTMEWYANHCIVAYTVRTIARASIELYGKHMLTLIASCCSFGCIGQIRPAYLYHNST